MHFEFYSKYKVAFVKYLAIQNIALKSPHKPPIVAHNAIFVTY